MRVIPVILVLMLAFTTLVMAQNMQPTTLENSECYDCHARGGGGLGPPMDKILNVRLGPDVKLVPGSINNIPIVIENAWVSELRDVTARLSINDAPSFSLTAVSPDSRWEESFPLPWAPNNNERTAEFGFKTVSGSTSWKLTVENTAEGGTASNYKLEIYAPNKPNAPSRVLEPSVRGGTITFQAANLDAVADLGYGDWKARIVVPPLLNDIQAGISDQNFIVSYESRFDVEGAGELVLALDHVIDGQKENTPQSAELVFPLFLQRTPGPNEKLQFDVVLISYYDHPPSIGAVDEWLYLESRSFSFKQPVVNQNTTGNNTGGSVVIVDDGEPDEPRPTTIRNEGIPLDAIGEILGYITVFTMLLSFWTGGIFGKWNKKLANKMFLGVKSRIAFHNLTSYVLTVAAIGHTVLFILEPAYPWSVGVLLGGVSTIGLWGLAITGMFQIPIIRSTSRTNWKSWHLVFAFLALLAGAAHTLLDGPHFREIQDLVGWVDPARPYLDRLILIIFRF